MKNKENRRKKKSQDKNKSLSCDRSYKKSDFTSMVFQSGRNSLCSPKQSKNMTNDKYQTYMQYISSGKFIAQNPAQKTAYFINKRNSITPTPKRISCSLMEQGRRSVTGKQNSLLKIENKTNFSYKHQSKSPKSKTKPLFVKGNNIVKVHEESVPKIQSKKKERPPSAKKKSATQKIIRKQQKEDKQQVKQKKVLEKLFDGIQFYRDLGKGAHALVKSGVDWNNKRKIAVKIYDKSQLKKDQLRSIERQAQILACVDHPNIIKLYQIMQSFKKINLIMEYGGGNSVEQYLRNKKKGYLEQGQAKNIFRQILEGVSYLHSNKIAHRDIKTDNILLNKYLKVKIIDFGFSLKVQPNTFVSQYCGTPTYMPPQVVTKTPHNPFLADRWSLGILLYTMLNGHCPFKAQNQQQLFAKICASEYTYQQFVSQESRNFISLFLRTNPEERIDPRWALKHKWFLK